LPKSEAIISALLTTVLYSKFMVGMAGNRLKIVKLLIILSCRPRWWNFDQQQNFDWSANCACSTPNIINQWSIYKYCRVSENCVRMSLDQFLTTIFNELHGNMVNQLRLMGMAPKCSAWFLAENSLLLPCALAPKWRNRPPTRYPRETG
jgi:hypothetical protein